MRESRDISGGGASPSDFMRESRSISGGGASPIDYLRDSRNIPEGGAAPCPTSADDLGLGYRSVRGRPPMSGTGIRPSRRAGCGASNRGRSSPGSHLIRRPSRRAANGLGDPRPGSHRLTRVRNPTAREISRSRSEVVAKTPASRLRPAARGGTLGV
jgi:hypothetical protein